MHMKILTILSLIPSLAIGALLEGCQSGGVDGDVAAASTALSAGPPRPVAPLSGSLTGSQRPELRWAGPRLALIEVCADRACTRPLQVFLGANNVARPPLPLPIGVVFWRLLVSIDGGHLAFSAPWELFVPRGGAAQAAVRGLRYDADGDGFADAAVREQQEDIGINRVHVYPGGATGIDPTRETVLTVDQTIFGVGFSAAGDVDGDGFGDLAVDAGAGVQVFAGSAAGVRPTPETVLTPPAGVSVFSFGFHVEGAGDVDGDGFGDLFVSDQFTQIWLYRGSATGLEPTPAWTLEAASGRGVRIGTTADVDGDGFADLVAIDSDPTSQRLRIFHGGAAGLEPPTGGTTIAWPTFPVVTAGDVNGDGVSDIIATASGAVVVVAGGPGGPSGAQVGVGVVPPRPFIGPIQSGDFDGDGFFDVAVTSSSQTSSFFFTDDQVDVYAGSAGGLNATPRTTLVETDYFANDQNNFGLRLGNADFDGDLREDLLVGAPPPFPTPFFDTSPSAAFVFRGTAGGGVETAPHPRLDGVPGFGNFVSAGAPQSNP